MPAPRPVLAFGEEFPSIAEAVRRRGAPGVTRNLVRSRLVCGWAVEHALTASVRTPGRLYPNTQEYTDAHA